MFNMMKTAILMAAIVRLVAALLAVARGSAFCRLAAGFCCWCAVATTSLGVLFSAFFRTARTAQGARSAYAAARRLLVLRLPGVSAGALCVVASIGRCSLLRVSGILRGHLSVLA